MIDADTHLLETRTLWADHLPAGHKDLALRIVDDELGYAWLTAPDGRRIHLAEAQAPGDVAAMGVYRARQRRGEPAPASFEEAVATHDVDPAARAALLDRQGIDEAVVFPNFGLFWVRALEDQPVAQLANMAAWNRWVVEGLRLAGADRLRPAGHVSLRDPDWLERHPELRVGLVEFTSSWFAQFLPALDASYRFHASYNGLGPDRLPLAPSDYLRRQVRMATFGFERPERLIATVGDLFMFGSDFPHAEGLARPLEDFQAAGGPPVDETTDGLYRGNVEWLLGR